MIALLTIFTVLSCSAQPSVTHAAVFARARSLDNGLSISGLEQTWNKDILDKPTIKIADFRLLKKLGFKSIRLPVAFEYFRDHHIALKKVLEHIDKILRSCNLYGFRLIICYHSGKLD